MFWLLIYYFGWYINPIGTFALLGTLIGVHNTNHRLSNWEFPSIREARLGLKGLNILALPAFLLYIFVELPLMFCFVVTTTILHFILGIFVGCAVWFATDIVFGFSLGTFMLNVSFYVNVYAVLPVMMIGKCVEIVYIIIANRKQSQPKLTFSATSFCSCCLAQRLERDC